MVCVVLFISCIIAYMAHVTSGCLCPASSIKHPQQKYCSAEFLIKGKVTGAETTYNVKVYKVDILAVIKTSYTITGKKQMEVKTNTLSCGVTLTVGQDYLIMASKTDVCNPATEPWNRKFHNKIKRNYLGCCACKVNTCGYKGDYGVLTDCYDSYGSSCNYNLENKRESKCIRTKGTCCKKGYSGCAWKQNRKLVKCLKRG